VSPHQPFALSIRRDPLNVSQVNKEAPTAEGEIRIAPLSPEGHDEIARKYIDDHVENLALRERLLAALGNSMGSVGWARLLSGPTLTDWMTFRFSSLRKRLLTEMIKAGLSEDEAEVAALRVVKTQGIAGGRNRPASPPIAEAPDGTSVHDLEPPLPVGKSRSLSDFRAALLVAIGKLSDEELRQLWIPAGSLWDSMQDELAKRR
jgi:hypothetical protein